jgi:hypothetical protein
LAPDLEREELLQRQRDVQCGPQVLLADLMSSLDLFYLSGWTTLILIAFCWMAHRPAGGAAPVGGE